MEPVPAGRRRSEARQAGVHEDVSFAAGMAGVFASSRPDEEGTAHRLRAACSANSMREEGLCRRRGAPVRTRQETKRPKFTRKDIEMGHVSCHLPILITGTGRASFRTFSEVHVRRKTRLRETREGFPISLRPQAPCPLLQTTKIPGEPNPRG